MDSFFSLFDPSDGNQDRQNNKKRQKSEQNNVKKKTEPAKGRRRGRRCNKNDTLPEECSFLCEPEISSELLVRDTSYIESFITDDNADDKKPKRRNSNRKCRRKRNKVSPPKESQSNAWDDNETDGNNKHNISKNSDDAIGKNVNDLSSKSTDGYDSDNNNEGFANPAVYNVIEKLEKVSLKDDTYLAGDFKTEDLENDVFYSSDDLESLDDSGSESEDAESLARGSLPPEPRFGNVEYKLRLVGPCERRFQHLVTQLKWRLRSGGGSAVYVVGVRDCGALRGLRARSLRASLHTLRRMARALDATLTRVTARRVAQHRAVAEVHIRKLADSQQSVELRVAVLGANEAGKSTLIGVLTQGELDNGRGSARLNMFRHQHEVRSGRTSSLSHEILGFTEQGTVVNYGCSELMTAERIGERSAKLVSFLDLAGHTKYQRTTLHGLTGYCPHYTMLVVSATGGVTRITEEHVALLVALRLPFFAVVTKCELAAAALPALLARLAALLAPHKVPVLITDEEAARECAVDNGGQTIHNNNEDEWEEKRVVPVFPVSCVRGAGLSALHAYLLGLQPPVQPADHERCEFQIDEIFHVGGDSNVRVVGGLMARGCLYENDNLLIGPLQCGGFARTTVTSVYRNRVPCAAARAGHSASLGLRRPPPLRAGMVLLHHPHKSKSVPSETRELHLEDPDDPRGCLHFQATVSVLRHPTAISAGFQCSALVANVRQTAVVEGIMSASGTLRAGQTASVVFRFLRWPEYLRCGRRLLLTAGGGTRAIGEITQVFPYIP